jgi:hypothetical protein
MDGDVGVCTSWDCRELCMVTSCDRCADVAVLTDDPFCADCMSYAEQLMSRD